MEYYLIFYASGVDSNSVTTADDGVNIDLASFLASTVSSIVAVEDTVIIYFRDAGRFEMGPIGSATELLEQSVVRLTVAEGKEIDVVKDLTKLFYRGPSRNANQILFDAVNDTWPISNVTGVQIRRHATTHTIASD